jgi:dienelactone hydrolase
MTTLESEIHTQVKSAANIEGGFLIITVQTPDTYDDEILFARDYAIKNYRVDTTRLYLTGWSYGGGGTWYGAGNYFGKFHAVAPIATTWTSGDWIGLAKAGTAIWAFHNLGDPNTTGTPVDATKSMVNAVNAANPKTKAVYTLFNDNSHGTGAAYDNSTPPYAPGGQGLTNPTLTLWQWFLKNSSTTRIEPPAATNSQTGLVAVPKASLSSNIVALDGRQSVGYKSGIWSTINAPAGVNTWSVQACGWITCSVTLPAQGTYTFRLTIKDAAGATSYNDVSVTYGNNTPAPVFKATKRVLHADGTYEDVIITDLP